MKKKIVALALISSLTMATAATANWNKGNMGGGDCPQRQGQVQQLDQATKDKLQQFFTDNKELHKEMIMKQAAKRALMRSDNPDPAAASKLAGELFDLRTTIREKAVAAGVEQYIGHGRMGMMGAGPGHHGGGRGKGMGQGMGMQQGNNNG
jgi:Spy/CpxP family protein refolding chaperone